jgi:hypothetical protein
LLVDGRIWIRGYRIMTDPDPGGPTTYGSGSTTLPDKVQYFLRRRRRRRKRTQL